MLLRGNTGLQSLSRELLHVEMDKVFHVQCGNWEAEDLTERQVRPYYYTQPVKQSNWRYLLYSLLCTAILQVHP